MAVIKINKEGAEIVNVTVPDSSVDQRVYEELVKLGIEDGYEYKDWGLTDMKVEVKGHDELDIIILSPFG